MSEFSHSAIPALGWHGSRFTGGLDASKGLPEISGQIYRATDTGIVYIGKADLSGWDILFYVGAGLTIPFYGIQTTRTPALSVANNTNKSIDHTSDTTVFGEAAIRNGTTLIVPTGKGGKWHVTISGRWNPPSNPGNIYMDIENSVGTGGGVGDWDGSIIDTTKNHAFICSGTFNWPAGTTFNLRAYQNTGASQTLQYYRVHAYLLGT